jgi:hypothetical protein
MIIANMRTLLWWEVIERGDFKQCAGDLIFYAACDSIGSTVQDAFSKHKEAGTLVLFYRPIQEVGE